MTRIVGAVLAGGDARRFGSDKALAIWQGRPLIDHAAAAVAPYVDNVVVIGRDHPGFDSAPDLPRCGLGPLGGIAGALAYALASGATSVLTAPCDVPAPPEALFTALVRPPSFCTDHPVFGHWPVTLAERLFEWTSFREDRSVRGFARSVGALPIGSPAPIADVDTRDDLERL